MNELPSSMRSTEQRRVLLDVVRSLKTHPTADEIYVLVKQRLPRISLAAVYRNLERMAEQGLIRKVVVDDGPMRFDGTLETHDHVRCTACGRIEDVGPTVTRGKYRKVSEETGYEILGHQVVYYGLCPRCRAERDKRGR